MAKTSVTVVDELETMAAHITAALLADRTLGGLCKTVHLPDTLELHVSEEGENPVGRLVLRGRIWYRQRDGHPDQPVA